MLPFYRSLLDELSGLLDEKEPVETGLANAAALLYNRMENINWAGFYRVLGHELALGPFQGKPACTVIQKGKGVCGTAWEQDRTQLVKDVHEFPGHIACDPESASEIVIPLHVGGQVTAVLDIDSPVTGRFNAEDEEGLEEAARLLERKLFCFQEAVGFRGADAPIGVLDSGVGGVSILRKLYEMLPGEDYIYRGDSAHAPYGIKTASEVQRYTFASAAYLLERGVKALVVACNTATSVSIARLREEYDFLPVIGVEPALKPAALSGAGKVLVMATPVTLRESRFRNLMRQCAEKAEIVPVSCGGLMEFVERGELSGENLLHYLREKLNEHLPAEAVVLGCTHYPFVESAISEVVGPECRIWESGQGTARELKRQLSVRGLLRTEERMGSVTFTNSSEDSSHVELSKMLFSKP